MIVMTISSSSSLLHCCYCRLNFKTRAPLLPSTFSPATALPSSYPIQSPNLIEDCCNSAKASAKKTRKRWAAQSSENQAAVVTATENLSPAGNESASDVIRNFYGGINGNDLASVNDLIADDCVYEDLIFSQPFVGRKAILEFFQKFIGSVSRDLQFVIDDISEKDNSAVGVMWHLEWKGKPFPFSKGCSFYRLDVINGRRQITYGRDCVEPAFKPGKTALAAIRGVTWLLQQFPQLADSLCGHGVQSIHFPLFHSTTVSPRSECSLSTPQFMATAAPKLTSGLLSVPSPLHRQKPPSLLRRFLALPGKPSPAISSIISHHRTICKATEVSVTEESSPSGDDKGVAGGGGDDGKNWIPVVPLGALPKGERRVIIQDGETILLLWYKNEVFAIENRSPAEGAYSEGLLNAKLTQDGCIVCPTTDSTFDLRTGAIKEWYPKNPVLRVLTPALRTLFIYPVKTDDENIYISMGGSVRSDASAEIVFSGKAQPGFTATDVNVEEVKMVVDEGLEGFGFTGKNELINGKAAVIGFLLLLDFELLTGKGLLKGTGFLDFIYSVSNAFK